MQLRKADTGNSPAESNRVKDRLLVIAARLFREKGYAATTTRELSGELGLQTASLYYHIGSKEDLLYELSLMSMEAALKEVDSAPGTADDPLEKLRALIRAHLRVILSQLDAFTATLIEMRSLKVERRAEIIALRDQYERRVREVIEDGQRSGALRRDISAQHLTLALLNLLNWSIFWYDPKGPRTPEGLGQMFATIFLEGSRTPERSESKKQPGAR
jgi:AcrR family transcriptional regulator